MKKFESSKPISLKDFIAFRKKTKPHITEIFLKIDRLKVKTSFEQFEDGGQTFFYSFVIEDNVLFERLLLGKNLVIDLISSVNISLDSFYLEILNFIGIKHYGNIDSLPLKQNVVDMKKVAEIIRPLCVKKFGNPLYVSDAVIRENRLVVYNPIVSSERLDIQFYPDGFWFIDWYDSDRSSLSHIGNSVSHVLTHSDIKFLLS